MGVNSLPIVIRSRESSEVITSICDEMWELPGQIEELEAWLVENEGKLNHGKWLADLGFHGRKGATGGGPVLTTQAMRIMISMDMELWFSEY